MTKSRELSREAVVDAALRGLERGDPLVVPGLANRLIAGVAGLVPRRFQLMATERAFRPSGPGAATRRGGGTS